MDNEGNKKQVQKKEAQKKKVGFYDPINNVFYEFQSEESLKSLVGEMQNEDINLLA